MSMLLDKYLKLKVAFTLDMHERPDKAAFLKLQEVNYRLDVVETIQGIYRAAKTMAYTQASEHYRMFDSYVTLLLSERHYDASNPEIQTKRETAHKAMQSVVNDYRKKFSSYVLKNGCDYIDDISTAMNTFLSAWLAYRNTYTEI